MIGSKAMRRKHQDLVSNCLVRVSNFQYTQVTTPSMQKLLESESLVMKSILMFQTLNIYKKLQTYILS